MPDDFQDVMLRLVMLVDEFEDACRAAELWWWDYKANQLEKLQGEDE